MIIRTAYCSGCDRQVRVVVRSEAMGGGFETEPDPHDLICLEHGESCTGDMCPLFAAPDAETRETIRRLLEHQDKEH